MVSLTVSDSLLSFTIRHESLIYQNALSGHTAHCTTTNGHTRVREIHNLLHYIRSWWGITESSQRAWRSLRTEQQEAPSWRDRQFEWEYERSLDTKNDCLFNTISNQLASCLERLIAAFPLNIGRRPRFTTPMFLGQHRRPRLYQCRKWLTKICFFLV